MPFSLSRREVNDAALSVLINLIEIYLFILLVGLFICLFVGLFIYLFIDLVIYPRQLKIFMEKVDSEAVHNT